MYWVCVIGFHWCWAGVWRYWGVVLPVKAVVVWCVGCLSPLWVGVAECWVGACGVWLRSVDAVVCG